MRNVMKRKVLPAVLLVLAMMLCSFPVIFAEAMDTEILEEEMTAEVSCLTEETAGSEQEYAAAAQDAEEPGMAAEAEEMTAEVSDLTEETPGSDPEFAPENGQETDPVFVTESDAEPEYAEPAEQDAGESGMAAETEKVPAEGTEADEGAEEVPAEESEPEVETKSDPEAVEESEGIYYEFDDDDAGCVSDELLAWLDNPEAAHKAEFTGTVDIELKDSEIAFGRDVTLVARVYGAETLDYYMVWEADDGDGCGWHAVGIGSEYTFLLTPDNMNREYRVVLYSAC